MIFGDLCHLATRSYYPLIRVSFLAILVTTTTTTMARPTRALREIRPPCVQGPTIPRKEAEEGEAPRLGAHLPPPVTPTPVAGRLAALRGAVAVAAEEAATAPQGTHPRPQAAPAALPPPVEEAYRVPIPDGRVALAPVGPATRVVRLPLIAVGLDVLLPTLRPRVPRSAASPGSTGGAEEDGSPKTEARAAAPL